MTVGTHCINYINCINWKFRSKIDCCGCLVSRHVFLWYDLDNLSKVSIETLMNMHGHITAVDGHKRRYTDACLLLYKTLRYLAGYRSSLSLPLSLSLSLTLTHTHTHTHTTMWMQRVKLGFTADLAIISNYKKALSCAELCVTWY